MMVIKRASLIHELEHAYARYKQSWEHEDKLMQRYWDGVLRSLHRVCELEEPRG